MRVSFLWGSRNELRTVDSDPAEPAEQTQGLKAVSDTGQMAQRGVGRSESIAGRRVEMCLETARPVA
jgi:hypothetical protein